MIQGVVSIVCSTVALAHPSRGGILSSTPHKPTHSNLIPETSGPDKPANEAFPAALFRTRDIHLLPPPSVSAGGVVAVYRTPEKLSIGATDL